MIIICRCSIEKTVLKERDGPEASSSKAQKAPASSLDKLIDNLKGPKVISTVTKSSTDWSTYKEKEGIEDEALTKAKDGYAILHYVAFYF